MDNITAAITKIKEKVTLEEWKERISDCQSSGMKAREWCELNGITTGSYYFHLRKVRESVLSENQIVPLEHQKGLITTEIRIELGELTVTLPKHTSSEQLIAVIKALKTC